MVIQHNIAALNAHRNLGINNSATNKNLEKLSSGFRINRAGDDAAGLAISEKMRGQIRGLAMAEQNTNNGISLIQTAEGGLNETHAILQRMRELAVQSSNGTYQDEDRAQIQLEVDALVSEIDRISTSTHYNGIKLLNGNLQAGYAIVDREASTLAGVGVTQVQVTGANNGSNIAADAGKSVEGYTYEITASDTGALTAKIFDASGTQLAAADYSFSATTLANGAQTITITFNGTAGTGNNTSPSDATMSFTTAATFEVGQGFELSGTIGAEGANVDSGAAAAAVAEVNAFTVDASTGANLIFQIGANGGADQQVSMEVRDMGAGAIGVANLSVATRAAANTAITAITDATNLVSSQRAELGAMQNRLEHTLNNLGVTKENLTAAESTIRDVDMAKEMMEFTKNSILVQASQAMLAQANSLPQGVLSLLR